MTWSINLTGHKDGGEGFNRMEFEKAAARVGRTIIESLKDFGLTSAVFNGNDYRENYLVPDSGEASS